MHPFEVEPNGHFVANAQRQMFTRPPAREGAVDCDHDLKLPPDSLLLANG
jgi:hypothetical protein